MLVLLIAFTLAFSSVALASGFYALTASPDPAYAWASNNYWTNYSAHFNTDETGYFMMEVWHDGNIDQTWLNLQKGWDLSNYPDYWGDSSSGWHTEYFRVYKQAGYNSLTKASGLLIDTQISVYRE